MKKYLALYMAPAPVIAEMMKATPEEMKAGMAGWMTWADKQKTALVDMGAPLGKSSRATAKGATDSKNEITGYSIVQADSAAAAAKIFQANPHLQMQGTWVEIVEFVPIPGA
jgi:hypothetical protein